MTRLVSGIPLIDRAWEGLRPGETYVVTGRAQSGLAVLLSTARSVTEAAAVCVYVTSTPPAALAAAADDLGFDIRAAAQQQQLRLLRPPTLPVGADPAEGLTSLAQLAQQSGAALLIVEDFTPFLAFQDLGALDDGVQRLVGALHPLPTVLVLGLGAPANDRSAAITQRLCDAVAGSVHVEVDGTEVNRRSARTLRLRPGTNIALAPATGRWAPGATGVPPAEEEASKTVLPHGDGYGDGYAPQGKVGRQVISGQQLASGSPDDGSADDGAPDDGAPERPASARALEAPASEPPASEPVPSKLPPAPSTPDAPMPSVAELNASLADIFGHPTSPAASAETTSPPPAPLPVAAPPSAAVPWASENGPPRPEALATASDQALQALPSSTPPAPVAPPTELDSSMMPSPPPKISALNLASVTFPVNPHLKPSEFELEGGVLMDSWNAAQGAQTFNGGSVSLESGPTFRPPPASPAAVPAPGGGDGLGQSLTGPPSFDFTGAPEFDTEPQPRPTRDPFSSAPVAMPAFASLAQHTFDQSPRGRFSRVVQGAFDAHARSGQPFLALAMRMDPANPFAEAFPLVEDAVRNAIDKRDPIYTEPDRKRLLALLPERTQSAAAGIYGAIKAQLQLSGGASDAVFTAIAAVTIPNGAPFANARDLMAFAFDTD
ncbi:MAG: hypothetical protein AAGF99_06885 [Bacteroidota bacterium]